MTILATEQTGRTGQTEQTERAAPAGRTELTGLAGLSHDADAGAEPGAAAAVCLFRSLGDPARLRILLHLALGEHRVVDLTEHVGLAQSTTSAHLACLRDCGLVQARTVGRSSVYSLAVLPELMDLLGAAERLLAVTGDAVTLCPQIDHTGEAHDETAAR